MRIDRRLASLSLKYLLQDELKINAIEGNHMATPANSKKDNGQPFVMGAGAEQRNTAWR